MKYIVPLGQKWSAKIGTPATLTFGNDDRTAVPMAYSVPGRVKICSTPMKSLFRVAKSPGFMTPNVGASPPATSVTCMTYWDITLRVKPPVSVEAL